VPPVKADLASHSVGEMCIDDRNTGLKPPPAGRQSARCQRSWHTPLLEAQCRSPIFCSPWADAQKIGQVKHVWTLWFRQFEV